MSYAYHPKPDNRNMLLALLLAGLLMVGWQVFVEHPRKQELARAAQLQAKRKATLQAEQAELVNTDASEAVLLPREERLKASPRLRIDSPKLHGSIDLRGARIDDITLAGYRTEVDPRSPEVILLSPQGNEGTYFAETGWVAGSPGIRVPDHHSVWKTTDTALTLDHPVTLTWDNGQGLRFTQTIALDGDYLFTLTQRVQNTSAQGVALMPYGLINRGDAQVQEGALSHRPSVIHEGPLGVFGSTLQEFDYKTLREKNKLNVPETSGWLGFTDKYWLTALIPADEAVRAHFSYYKTHLQDRYQADYLGQPLAIPAGGSVESSSRFFAGAKEIGVLDRYTKGETGGAPVPLFDRAVDFGVLYFLTKPIFLLLQFFHQLVGNFGMAILLLTVVIKACMFPLANKSYHATSAMRALQPEMLKLKERHGADKLKLNQEMMALYKSQKVNPASGCLPILIQMPVFFALYKVLNVTIEMRHAPLAGWIVDLSAPDPSNLFNLFGLLHFTPPSFLHLGVLPILMAVTMYFQMKSQPTPTDPVQAQILKVMPWFFMIFAAKFPAGLVFYWVCSNTMSIIQQAVITRGYTRKKATT